MAEHIPQHRKPRADFLGFGGIDLGSVVGLALAPFLIQLSGWVSVFYLSEVAGFLWALGG